MVHNGVEYGMLQAYAEGFEILQKSRYDYDLRALSSLWNQGSVVRSWLLELAESAFEKDANLDGISGYVEDSGEGRWTVLEAIEEDVPANAIAGSLFARFASRQDDSFAMKVIAALRGEFGRPCDKRSRHRAREIARRWQIRRFCRIFCAMSKDFRAYQSPGVMVIFGASGDLTSRKLVPALYDLVAQRRLPEFAVVGISRTEMSHEEFRDRLRKTLEEQRSSEVSDDVWESFRTVSSTCPATRRRRRPTTNSKNS